MYIAIHECIPIHTFRELLFHVIPEFINRVPKDLFKPSSCLIAGRCNGFPQQSTNPVPEREIRVDLVFAFKYSLRVLTLFRVQSLPVFLHVRPTSSDILFPVSPVPSACRFLVGLWIIGVILTNLSRYPLRVF